MLDFYTRVYPWSYITESMTEDLPTGKFYMTSDVMVPRTSKMTEFTLVTDRGEPVEVINNNQLVARVNPTAEIQPVFLQLHDPPSINLITADNGVDEPVHLLVVATHVTSMLELFGIESYEFSGRTIQKYYDLISSVWHSFIAEYQLPWRRVGLPDIRSLRLMSVKMIMNTLINETGRQGGVTDFLSAFIATTPVWKEAGNPEIWQPDIYQPVTSSDDVAGFEAHVWMPNLCVARWNAFITLVNNVQGYYDLYKFSEEAVTVNAEDSDLFEQHRFNNLSEGACSIRGLIEFLGCMDRVTAGVGLQLKSEIPICAYSNPMDMFVDPPGIGGEFFDSDTDFDGDYGPFDGSYDVDALTDYWVGMSTKKAYDFGGCLDTYPTLSSVLPENVNCCKQGPDTVNLNTMSLEESVESLVAPNHPVFGGDNPGMLSNPYFNELL